MIPAILPIRNEGNACRTFYDDCYEGATKATTAETEVRTPINYENKPISKSLGNKDWITCRQAATLFNLEIRSVQRCCKDGKYVTRWIDGNGGKQREIFLTSILDTLSIEDKLKFYKENGIIANDFNKGELQPINCNSKGWEIALAKCDVLKFYEKAYLGKSNIVECKKEFIKLFNAGLYPELLEKVGPVSFGSIERWRKLYADSNNDTSALAPNYKPRCSSVNPGAAKILLDVLLDGNKPLINEGIRIAKAIMKERGIPDGLSDVTYRRWIEKYRKDHEDIWTLKREGEKALNDKVSPYLLRDKNLIEVGDVVVADGHVLNFYVTNPFTGKPKRMTLVLFFDWKSGMPLGFEIMPTENKWAIASALRRTILMLGFIPRVVYLDNGKAFRAKYFTSIPDFNSAGIRGLYDRIGMMVVFAMAYHGQSKVIERFFEVFAELERRLPTYIGTSIEKKPAWMMRNEKYHLGIRSKLPNTSLTIHEAYTLIIDWFKEYAEREHIGGFDKRLKPIEIFNESIEKVKLQPDFNKRLIAREHLNYLMMSEEVKTINRNGIRFAGEYYWNEALYGRRHAAKIKYDFVEKSEILVFDDKDNYICHAQLCGYTHPMARVLGTEEDVLRLEAGLAEKGKLKKLTKDASNEFFQEEYFESRKLLNSERITPTTLSDKIINQPKPIEKVKPEYDAEEISSMILNDEQVDEEYFDLECEAEEARHKKQLRNE